MVMVMVLVGNIVNRLVLVKMLEPYPCLATLLRIMVALLMV